MQNKGSLAEAGKPKPTATRINASPIRSTAFRFMGLSPSP